MVRAFLQRLPRNFVPTVLIILGAVLLLYVVSQYGEMYFEQKRMADAWEQQQRQGESLQGLKDDGMVRLVIPKIELTSFIVEGTNHKSLLVGPGHMKETVAPGERGNSVITGHRDTFFRHIHELNKGDQFYVERGGKRYVYEVTGKKIVDPDDMSVTRPTNDAQVTLITCYPTYYIGPAPQRLVVFSKLASHQEGPLTASEGADKKPVTQVHAVGVTAVH
jgi:LPXTG-site transpeptidase (sortase) family protein